MLIVNHSKCLQCQFCVDICPILAVKYNKKNEKIEIDQNKCIECMACAEACPRIAIIKKRK